MNLETAQQKSLEDYKRKGKEFFYNSAFGRARKSELDELFAGNMKDDREAGLKLLVLAQLTMQFECMSDDQPDEKLVEMAEKAYQKMEAEKG